VEEEENPFEEPKSKSSGQPASKSGKSETKKSISDYNYYLGSAKQASDYETMTEYLINYIKKTYSRKFSLCLINHKNTSY
jgi:hypothetical protein